MNYTEWMERTNRGMFKPRSAELKLVDEEMKKIRSVGDISQLSALRKALDGWKKAQGPFWSKSIRNHDGAVQELDKLINANASVFNQAALAARLSQTRQNNAGVAVNQQVKQVFGGSDPTFKGTVFKWNIVMNIVKRGTCVEAKVTVAGQMSDGTAIPDDEKSAFKTHILTAWNVATVIVTEPEGRLRYYDLMFDIEWVDRNATVPKYVVDIHRLHRRDDMGNWTFGNREACIHEFGHMIGCPDEYNTVEIQGFGQVIHDPAMYSGDGYTTNSIMNNPGSQGRIHDRHFSFVARQCRQIFKVPTEIKILRRIGPTQVEEVNQLMVAAAHGRRRMLGFDDD